MQNQNQKNAKTMKFSFKTVMALVMLVAMLVQMFAFSAAAVATELDLPILSGGASSSTGKGNTNNSFGGFDSDEVIEQLRKDFLGSLNDELVKKIEDYQLTGSVGVILTFSNGSLVESYKKSSAFNEMTYSEYRETNDAKKIADKIHSNQISVLDTLMESGLITKVEHTYSGILDGAFVRTTYEQIADICDIEGVERVTLSNTYLPAIAVDNPVDVYDTGIFNSSDISFTGKGTIVAILDTGCDYTHAAFTTHEVVDPLYDRDDIAGKLENLIAYSYDESIEVREVYYGNITGGKIAFGYDYADKDTDIMPFSSEHGTHVAGIIGGKDDTTITGVAIDTQFAIMKVFSDYEAGAEDGDILAALDDSVSLGVDAINMSLGSSCGFTFEYDPNDPEVQYKNEIYSRIEDAGISLVVAASNDYSSGFGSEDGNTNKKDNPDSATVGSPSTYDAAMSVASINGNKENYMFVNGDREVFFNEAFNMNSKEYNFFEMLGVNKDNPTVEFEYVTIPGYGYKINYSGYDMAGKIALVSRGDITFEEKVQYAYEAGAAAIIIYNNVFGEISMTVGNDLKIPVISISKDDGDAMAKLETGKVVFDFENEAGPFMSDFSSWGPTPDLKLKPEITAHGGNILSAIPGGEYDELSGTSMAAPNMCGITVLIRQYVKEKYPEMPATEVRDLVNELCMSTATIALDKHGNPYSPRKQGAGIADIEKATTTPAYLYVLDENGENIGKTKLELGADPARTGVYTMTVQLKNISDSSVSYKLGNIVMTESISTSEPEYVAEIAYILSSSSEYTVSGDGTLENGVVTIGAGKTAAVTAKITLSAADKAYLNSTFENGMYVEGFFTFDNVNDKGIDLNAPFLAFYGDWADAPIFDLDYYEVETEAHNNAIDDDDKIKADYYATTPYGSYYYDYIIPLGSYVYKMDEEEYTAIPGTREHAAVSYFKDAISGVYGVFTGLLRGAKEMNITIVDKSTGEVVWEETQYNCYKAHYGGAAYPYVSRFNLSMVDRETGEIFGANNTQYEVTMSAKLDWEGETRNSSDTYSFSFYIDNEAPTVTDASFRTEYDKTKKENRYYVDLMVYDNHYAMSVRPVVLYEIMEDGEMKRTYSSLSEYPIPVYQESKGETTKVSFEITDYIDIIANSSNPEGLTIYLDDYAMNPNICYVPFPGTEDDDFDFVAEDIDLDKTTTEIDVNINDTFDLTKYLLKTDSADVVEPEYLKNLTWTSSDETVVAVKNGQIEAKKTGNATITVTGRSWKEKKSIVIKVGETVNDNNPNSAGKVSIDSLKFVSYDTLFAFNGDIDFSEIGRTDSFGYFDGNASISFYPSEQVKLNYALEPWNLSEDRYTLEWISSNPRVATVDENGVVTAESEGNARITLKITIDGKTSVLTARCSIEVKSEFIIENRMLIAYKGKGGDVVIPDDEGILYIGAYAFCHFDLDNEKEVEVDEDGYYDFDDKKTPLENNTVTSVIVPDGVEYVEKYAFYNCNKLESVQLPDTCKSIGIEAFSGCEVLEDINLKNVNFISDYAFYGCDSLTGENIGEIDLSEVYSIGRYAFAKTRLDNIKLSNLSLTGEGAFSDCKYLESVELGVKTRVAKKMFENSAVEEIVIYSDIVGDAAFKNCTELTSLTLKKDLTYLGAEAFSGCKKLAEVSFEAGCEEIAKSAFFGCKKLVTFALPDCKVIIGEYAFAESAIETIVFEENTEIVRIGRNILNKVENFTVDVSESNVYKIENNVLYTKDKTVLVMSLPTNKAQNFVVPQSVTTIADGAFAANVSLKSIEFESGSQLKKIGEGAFLGCNILSTVVLPDRNVIIGDAAFYDAAELQSINLDKVTSVGEEAFVNTKLNSINLSSENVIIKSNAFYGLSYLKSAVIGKGATVGEFAFSESGLIKVEFEGEGVSVGNGAFAVCLSLSDFDFEDLSQIGDSSFAVCPYITIVNIPNVKEIGWSSFADCHSLESFSAENLEVIGGAAFAPRFVDIRQGAVFTTIYAPKLREIGDEAFFACTSLKEIDLSNVTKLGFGAFYECTGLEEVTLGENLTEISDYTFYECENLTSIDLSNVVRIGSIAFYHVPLSKDLDLEKTEYIGAQAFFGGDVDAETHYIETVNAPNLTEVAEQAFVACVKLKSIYAPKLEKIGSYAFAYTAIEEFEITENLKEIESSVFEGCENFKAFYTTVDSEKIYDNSYENAMIKDGVLYTVSNKGYVLASYPMAKEGEILTVEDGTVRIEFGAALGNKNIKRVILPESLKYIGNHAFSGCENLETVVFNSYYAPMLESTWTSNLGVDENNEAYNAIVPGNIDMFTKFDELYKYNYYYEFEEEILYASVYHYNNFKGLVATDKAEGLTYVIPENSKGYDSLIYSTYFTASETETAGTVMGPYAIAFIEAVDKLDDVTDRFDKALVDNAVTAYNALIKKTDEMAFVDAAVIEKYKTACSQYNVSVAENKINRLFDLDNSKYSFDIVKDARAAVLKLTESELSALTNKDKLDAKITELATVMGVTPDFSLNYEDHFEAEEPPVENDPIVDNNGGEEEKKSPVLLIIIIVAAVLAAGGVAVVLILKKKKSSATVKSESKEFLSENNASAETIDEASEDEVSEEDKKED